MYRSFEIQNFRGFKDLIIPNLKQINLITGKNNVGKTALLEAFYLDIGLPNMEIPLKINAFRGFEGFKVELKIELGKRAETPWDSLFHSYSKSPISFKSTDDSGKMKKIIMQVFRDESNFDELNINKKFRNLLVHEVLPNSISKDIQSHIPSSFSLSNISRSGQLLLCSSIIDNKKKDYAILIGLKGIQIYPTIESAKQNGFFLTSKRFENSREIADLFGYLQKNRLDKELTDILKFIEPRLTELKLIMEGQQPFIEGDIGLTRLLPVNLMGEGMVTILIILLFVANAKDGFVLIDEIENGFHHSILTKVWTIIGEAAKRYNVQVFATTHSYECITASVEAFKNEKEDFFNLLRIDKFGEVSKVTTYSKEELENVKKFNVEVR
jgi:AAA15 family ATPase/GTPase